MTERGAKLFTLLLEKLNTFSNVMKGYNWAGSENIFTDCGFRCKLIFFIKLCQK